MIRRIGKTEAKAKNRPDGGFVLRSRSWHSCCRSPDMTRAALVDVDGTLIDNNLLHVLAWRRAFERVGFEIDANRIVHAIGMGGDRLAPAILSDMEEDLVERARIYHAEEYVRVGLIHHARALPGAARLLDTLRARGVRIGIASSSKREEFDQHIAQLGSAGFADVVVTKEDVATTKPAPDIFATALAKLGTPEEVVVIGDTVYDLEAATKLGLPCICVLTGGIERELLEGAGAIAIYPHAGAIADDIDKVIDVMGGFLRAA